MKKNFAFKALRIFLVILLVFQLFGCELILDLDFSEIGISTDASETTPPIDSSIGNIDTDDEMQLHFLDVGQGDCSLILAKDCVVLIDSGDKSKAITSKIIDYIKQLKITEIDYFILTHPHADHIGGAPEIIEEFEINNVIMPNAVTDTVIFSKTLDAIENNDINLIQAKSGDTYTLGNVTFKILAPNKVSYTNMNNYSIALRVEFYNTFALFTGDMEDKSEEEVLSVYQKNELKADVLKVAHHGSETSSTPEFLEAVSPDFAVISVGEGNSYKHPHAITLDKLTNMGITYYRTDLEGTVIFSSDGNNFIKK